MKTEKKTQPGVMPAANMLFTEGTLRQYEIEMQQVPRGHRPKYDPPLPLPGLDAVQPQSQKGGKPHAVPVITDHGHNTNREEQ